MSKPFVLLGWQLSYFTGKTRSHLLFKGIPFVERPTTFWQYGREAPRRTGAAVIDFFCVLALWLFLFFVVYPPIFGQWNGFSSPVRAPCSDRTMYGMISPAFSMSTRSSAFSRPWSWSATW